MKLQISFDLTDLDKALSIATQVADYVDVFEVGTLLIFKHGTKAIESFQQEFSQKIILADTKIADRGKDTINLIAGAGADWMTVLAGTSNDVIHSVCTAAQEIKKKVMVDLIDAKTLGQSALEAKNLGASALLFHQPHDEKESRTFLDNWEMVRGNTQLPIYVSGKIKRDTVDQFIVLRPAGLVIGKSIIEAQNPREEAQFFYELCNKE